MQKVFRVLVLFLVLFLLGGCVLNEFFAVTPREGETEEEFEERQAAARAKAVAGTSVLLGVLSVLWPPGVVLLGTAFVVIRKYKPYHDMLVAVIKAIEAGAPKKTAEEPVKLAVQALQDPVLNREVYNTTHPAI